MRESEIRRQTRETDVYVRLQLDAGGAAEIDSGCGFLDHMLQLFSCHSGFGLTVRCSGDTQVDFHHSVEDIGICLGQALLAAVGDKRGIARYGSCLLPMDEALVLTAADLSGRDFLAWDLPVPSPKVGDFDTELAEEFFRAFTREARLTLHVRKLAGTNSHHILEAAFKSLARSLAAATALTGDERVPSSKGVL